MGLDRRLVVLTISLPVLAGIAGVVAWLVVGFMPLRDAVGGPFAARQQTPAQNSRSVRSSWLMFGASAARSRYMPSPLRPPFRVVYSVPAGGLIEMPPVVASGHAVFGTHDGVVLAFRPDDGLALWSRDLGKCIASSPALRNGVVYVGWAGTAPCQRGKDEHGGMVAMSLATGKVLWRFHTGNVEASPAIIGETLFFSAFRTRHESHVYAMRLGPSRRLLWSFPIASKVASSPAVADGTIYVSAYDRKLYALNARTGRLRWETSAFSDTTQVRLLLGVKSLVKRRAWSEGGYYATPAIAYRHVYLGTIDGVFSAFDARTGAHRWSNRLGDSIYGSAAVWRAQVFVGTTDGTFHALAARDGRELWTQSLEGKILGSPTVTNGRVFIATTARKTFVFDALTGELEWQFPDGHYSPLVVAGGRGLLVGKGRVYGIENGTEFTGRRAS